VLQWHALLGSGGGGMRGGWRGRVGNDGGRQKWTLLQNEQTSQESAKLNQNVKEFFFFF